MRSFFSGLVTMIVVLGVFIASVFFGIQSQSWGVFWFSLIAGTLLGVLITNSMKYMGRTNMDDWLSSVGDCQYNYAWDGTGVAVNTKEELIHLAMLFKGVPITNTYSFSAVREWGYNIEGYTLVDTGTTRNVGAGIGASMSNAAAITAAQEKSGLWVGVADIEHPRWFIKFRPDKQIENELLRWMEIFRQSINKT